VLFPSSDTGYIYGENAFLKTTNGGINWNVLGSSAISVLGNIFFTSNDIGFWNRVDTLLKTTDGANTWQPVLQVDQMSFFTYFINPDTGFTIGINIFSMDSIFVYKTTNNGSTWSFVHSDPIPVSTYISKVYFENSNIGFITLVDGAIIRTFDGGNSWTTVYNSPTYDLVADIQFPTPSIGYAVGFKILKTTDGGLTWTEHTTPIASNFKSCYFTSADTGFIVGGNGFNSGSIIKTNDGGINWTLSLTSNQSFYSVYFPAKGTGYTVGGNGMIKKYINNAATSNNLEFTNNNFNFYPNPVINELVIESNNYNENNKFEILNSIGLVIYKGTIKEKTVVNTTNLALGVYFIKLKNGNSNEYEKFVKE
jgi:photosystem II stability/assembly factor-like uncharacterized protein